MNYNDIKELSENVSPDVAMRNNLVQSYGQILAERLDTDISTHLKVAAKPSKYHNQRTKGYASQKEADYAEQLAIRQKAGEVWFWLEEVAFKLPGGVKHRVDFLVFYSKQHSDCCGRSWELVEIKGRDLPMGKLKRKQVEDIYKVRITVI